MNMKASEAVAALGGNRKSSEKEPCDMSEANIIRIPVDQLQANDWNPNELTEEELAELLAEIKHLGHVPKPLVVRKNGDGFIIIDGEHCWLAAKEAGLGTVECEVIKADDFEAMRQTYKRNQHGRHGMVKQGRMFRRMLEMRGISNRELAEQMELSEGTIRNSLIYAEAAELDQDYNFDKLTTKQMRVYRAMPSGIGKLWLDCGANPKAAWGVKSEKINPNASEETVAQQVKWFHNEEDETFQIIFGDLKRFYERAEESGLFQYISKGRRSSKGFLDAMNQISKWLDWEEGWTRKPNFITSSDGTRRRWPGDESVGIDPVELRRYSKHYYGGGWNLEQPESMDECIRRMYDAEKQQFLLTAEELRLPLSRWSGANALVLSGR